MATFEDWLLNEGIDIAIALGIGIGLYIVWAIICYVLKKGFVETNVKSKQVTRRSTAVAKKAGTDLVRVTTHEAHDNDNDNNNNDEKDENATDATTENNDENENKDEKSSGYATTDDSVFVTKDERIAIESRATTVVSVIRTVGNMVIYAIVLIAIIEAVGAPTNSLLSFVALSGLVLALAAADSVKDFVGGLFILVEGTYNIGETCTINGIFGEIERMTLRVTYMRGLDGTLYTVPNGDIRDVANHHRGFTATVMDVGITYESDIDKCINLLNNEISEAVKNDARISKDVLNKPCIDGIGELAGSSVNIRFLIVSKPGLKALVQRVCNEHIFRYLKSDLAYPTKRLIVEQAN